MPPSASGRFQPLDLLILARGPTNRELDQSSILDGSHGLMPFKETGCWLNNSPRHFSTAVQYRTNKKADAANPGKEFTASAFSIAHISSNKKSRREETL